MDYPTKVDCFIGISVTARLTVHLMDDLVGTDLYTSLSLRHKAGDKSGNDSFRI